MLLHQITKKREIAVVAIVRAVKVIAKKRRAITRLMVERNELGTEEGVEKEKTRKLSNREKNVKSQVHKKVTHPIIVMIAASK